MKSVLIIGMGTLGRKLAAQMQELGNEVMIVDRDEDVIQKLSPTFHNSFIGDCTDEGVLRSLGVNNFDYCFVAIGEDFYASLEITSLLKELGAECVISKARRSRQAEFLLKIGADEVFYPEEEMAERLAIRYNSENIFNYIDLPGALSIFETSIKSEWIGKTIESVCLKEKYNLDLIAIKKDTEIIPVPSTSYCFQKNDHIMIIAKSDDVFSLVGKMPE